MFDNLRKFNPLTHLKPGPMGGPGPGGPGPGGPMRGPGPGPRPMGGGCCMGFIVVLIIALLL